MSGELSTLADSVLVAVRGYLAKSLEPIAARFKSIEERIAAIPAGAKGEPGEPGAPGKDGVDGKSVELSEVVEVIAPRVDVSIEQAIKCIPLPVNGKDGEPGANGEPGPKGDPGEKGEPGESVSPEAVAALVADAVAAIPKPRDGVDGNPGEKGFDGLPGKDGTDGQDGRDGKEGPAGRDALRIDVLESIDETRAYARGTYAEYRGGTIHATRTTDPLADQPDIVKAGWHVVLNGIADETEIEIDDRTVERVLTFTNGKTIVRRHVSVAMIYRGLWNDATEYRRGDAVTWGGSQYHCDVDGVKEQPLTAAAVANGAQTIKGWTLSVKRGRDGKSAESSANQSAPAVVRLR